ncbi:MAG: hypothetical protein II802_01130 [Clostridia bacterium]|nr:hypothetical protein [Clostridia bacterium]
MDTLKIKNKGNTKIIAHRGLSGIEKENSNAAFVAAGNRGYYGIETDVHITKDGKFIIIHDDNTGRVSKTDISVEGSQYEQLRSIHLLDTDGVNERCDLLLPNLREYLDICKRYNKKAVLELKNEMHKSEIFEICKIAEDMDYFENVIFISFSFKNLEAVKARYPLHSVQFLCNKISDSEIKKLKKNNMDLDVLHNAVNKELVNKCHKNGIKVNCWTVNKISDAERLIACKVDFITTNILE